MTWNVTSSLDPSSSSSSSSPFLQTALAPNLQSSVTVSSSITSVSSLSMSPLSPGGDFAESTSSETTTATSNSTSSPVPSTAPAGGAVAQDNSTSDTSMTAITSTFGGALPNAPAAPGAVAQDNSTSDTSMTAITSTFGGALPNAPAAPGAVAQNNSTSDTLVTVILNTSSPLPAPSPNTTQTLGLTAPGPVVPPAPAVPVSTTSLFTSIVSQPVAAPPATIETTLPPSEPDSTITDTSITSISESTSTDMSDNQPTSPIPAPTPVGSVPGSSSSFSTLGISHIAPPSEIIPSGGSLPQTISDSDGITPSGKTPSPPQLSIPPPSTIPFIILPSGTSSSTLPIQSPSPSAPAALSSSTKRTAIIAIVSGLLGSLLIFGVIVFFLMRRHRRRQRTESVMIAQGPLWRAPSGTESWIGTRFGESRPGSVGPLVSLVLELERGSEPWRTDESSYGLGNESGQTLDYFESSMPQVGLASTPVRMGWSANSAPPTPTRSTHLDVTPDPHHSFAQARLRSSTFPNINTSGIASLTFALPAPMTPTVLPSIRVSEATVDHNRGSLAESIIPIDTPIEDDSNSPPRNPFHDPQEIYNRAVLAGYAAFAGPGAPLSLDTAGRGSVRTPRTSSLSTSPVDRIDRFWDLDDSSDRLSSMDEHGQVSMSETGGWSAESLLRSFSPGPESSYYSTR